MADYKQAISKVLRTEGGYVNDKSDRGGETYKGISRVNWPNWEGWFVVDRHKNNATWPKILKLDTSLTGMVERFYKKEFWDKVGGDKINRQDVADLLLDSAVNEGFSPAIKRAEKIIGIKETGRISNLLITKLNSL